MKLSPQIIRVGLRDLLAVRQPVFDNTTHIKAALSWLKRAQDIYPEGGVVSWYSLFKDWGYPFIETTGYIIGTFLDCYRIFGDEDLKKRAIAMADYIVSMQLRSGGFRTYPPEQQKRSSPTVFNTGQDILGLVDIFELTKSKKYLKSAKAAADFLCSVQNKDGSFSKYELGEKARTYETRTAWALLRVYEKMGGVKYLTAARKNLNWAKSQRLENGWFERCAFSDQKDYSPFTHTLSYTIEGFLWSGEILKDKKMIAIAEGSARVMRDYYLKNNFLPGQFAPDWSSGGDYSCLTGDAQLAVVWFHLYKRTHDKGYLKAAKKMTQYLKTTQDLKTKQLDIRGAIKGSDPIFGELGSLKGYCRMAYVNWAAKFFIDALIIELEVS